MTAERQAKLKHEARIHYQWLREKGMTLNDIETTARELLRLWDIEATDEAERLRREVAERSERHKKDRMERLNACGPDYDASGVFIE